MNFSVLYKLYGDVSALSRALSIVSAPNPAGSAAETVDNLKPCMLLVLPERVAFAIMEPEDPA